ncbi:hypothetical protein D6D19_05464 [Aureobasidium pullulans]|uniref:Beta-taxilin n=1 Tax=Aureobasidium pullulans TaxID=5580 RepID=A0A4S9A3Q5_AURPU|nr:hypothetical protein D6D19_05464 [Aureobasidium pullulans]THY85513.1 hypothetical protein D6C92_08853 [Aureobasidium pullulans]
MAQVAAQHQPHSSRASPASVHEHRDDAPLPAAPPPPPNNGPAGKKSKAKKGAADTNDAHKQLQAKIAQLEQDATGRAEEDAEIDREVKKANRDLQNLLQSMDGPISKMETVQRKYSELLAEMKRTEREHIKAKKRGDQLQKDKDTQRSELTKANSMKEKLEKLSRELTKENKKLKEDLREMKESAADKNEELHRRLERMVGDVEQVITDRKLPDRPTGELEEDKLFREKFKSFVEQYEMREIQFHSLLRSKDLEIQYHLARQEQLRKQQDAELSKSHQLTRQVSTFSQTENELRSQLNIYVEKFKQQVEDTLNNSNDLFLTFRKEMEEMSKKSKRLEKENMQLTRKQEATNKNIFQMAEERSQSQSTIDRLHKENEKLKKLCRAMQTNGYGRADMVNAAPGAPNPAHHPDEEDEEDDLAETDSEYDEYDEDEEGSVEAEYDDDTEDEAEDQRPRTYGPVPPPPPPPPTGDLANGGNGKARQHQQPVNGVKH